MGKLGADQLEWLEDDLRAKSPSTPIVLFVHIPLWAVYPEWGWTTQDSQQALSYVKRFGSVTVLNGTFTRSCRRWKGTSRSIPRCPRRFHNRLPVRLRLPDP